MKIGNCEIKNRIVMSPMLMGFGRFDGCVTEQLMDYYEERAKGGTGTYHHRNYSYKRLSRFGGVCATRRKP